MSTRTSSALLLVALAGCQQKLPDKAAEVKAERDRAAFAAAEGKIECALGSGDAFAPRCSIDRTQTQDGLYLTLRHPDGGFHRLLVTRDGRGVVAADGAEPAVVTPVSENAIEVALAGVRYRLPATVRPAKPR